MELFREFCKKILKSVKDEFVAIQISNYVKNEFEFNIWTSKTYITNLELRAVEKTCHDYNMLIKQEIIMIHPDSSLERMNTRIYMHLTDNNKEGDRNV